IDAPRDLRLRYGRRVVRVEYQTAGRMVTREFPLETLGDDAEFIALLRGGKVQTIHTLEATLEDIFIEVTGRRLEGDDCLPPPAAMSCFNYGMAFITRRRSC